MCLILFSCNDHPTYKMVIAANRDEFFDRRTQAADFWKDHPSIVGGRDLEAMGTWMAMTRTGRIAMVTNYRDPKNIRASAPSRGKLVTDYLLSDETPAQYLTTLELRAKEYNGFNLIVGDQDTLSYFSNYKSGIHSISSGLHGLSNHLLETPWPKVVHGKEKLGRILLQKTITPADIFEALYDVALAADDQLPDTGIGKDRERSLSSMFIRTDGYGTRCSTAVLITHANEVTYAERVYDLSTYASTSREFRFTV